MIVFRSAVLLFFFIFLHFSFLFAGSQAVLLTRKQGVLISSNDGKSWRDFTQGLPDDVIPTGLKIDRRKTLYLSTLDSGLYRSGRPYTNWTSLNSETFRTRRKTGRQDACRKISAFTVNDSDPSCLMAATKHSLYRSTDRGASWSPLPLDAIDQTHYITALSYGADKGTILAGTSFSGLYRTSGGRLVQSSSGLPREPYSAGLSFCEEITALARDTARPGVLYAGFGFGGGLYISENAGATWKAMSIPLDKKTFFTVHDIAASDDAVYVSAGTGIYRMDRNTHTWKAVNFGKLISRVPESAEPLSIYIIDESAKTPPLMLSLGQPSHGLKEKNHGRAIGRRALYSSVPVLTRKLTELVSTIHQCGYNAIVIDMKDDYGNLYFPAENTTAREIGAAKKLVNLVRTLGILKKKGIYTIARMVVFKDIALFRAYNGRYAIRDRTTDLPWQGNGRERWVDPHSQFVQEYNIALAREVERLGFDEIQFDYIRFPTDGPVNRCVYRYRDPGDSYKSEVLADFLYRAKKTVSVPISVDVYGFTAWYQFGNSIGQDLEEFARIVDVLCPMVYPSHFGTRFYRGLAGNLHPYTIVHDSGIRARIMAGNGVIIRPYLQAFNMLSPTWGPEYLQAQIRGAADSGCSGYTFWNAGGEYSMVRKIYKGGHKK